MVKKEPKKEPEDNSQESRKRKSLDGGEEREPEAKRLRSEELEQNFSNKVKKNTTFFFFFFYLFFFSYFFLILFTFYPGHF